jgi:hypothetical protein
LNQNLDKTTKTEMEDEEEEENVKKRKKQKNSKKQNLKVEEEEEEEEEEEMDEEFDSKKKRKKKKKKDLTPEEVAKENYVRKRLKLDDALSTSDSFAGWSPARVKAYKLLATNPNAYYYRFNAPGETQQNGAWSKEEKDLFFERIKTFDLRKEGATQV